MATYHRGRGFGLTRSFSAPPADVFAAWTDPALLGWFFNPAMPTDHPAVVDLREGGEWRLHMVIDGGTDYFTGGLYREIVPDTLLVFYWGAVGGWPALDREHPENSPLVTLTFAPDGEGTRMDFRLSLPDHFSEEETTTWMDCGMIPGWAATIDRLVFEPAVMA